MNQIWAISKKALFRSIENELLVIQFPNTYDRTKVLEGMPWTFDQKLVMITGIDNSSQPSEITMTQCLF